jgi:hypothetical protein
VQAISRISRLALLLLALGLPRVVAAQTGTTVPPPPVDLTAGLDTRLREEHLQNVLDFDRHAGPSDARFALASDAQYFRVRHRVWGQAKLRSGPCLYARFTAEWRRYVNPWLWNPSTGNRTEVILDNFYIDVPALPHLPASLRVGRQDLIRGEGFILMDGGPLDGSRSIYQNAILLGIDGKKLSLRKTKIELMAIRNLAWDHFVPINGPSEADRGAGRRKMVENNETAFGLYVTQSDLPRPIEAYYFYKESQSPTAKAPFLKLHTIGARVSGPLPAALRFAAEGAYQFGADGSASDAPDHRSFGGYLWLSRAFMAPLQPTLRAGAVYLSGDDPKTSTDQAWVPLFSRWPEWSELYIYTQIAEDRGVAYWTNLSSLNASIALQLTTHTRLAYTYYALWAPDAPASPGHLGLLGNGRTRGQEHQWLLTSELSRHVTGHLRIDRFTPGSFYGVRLDDAYFIRWELMLKY